MSTKEASPDAPSTIAGALRVPNLRRCTGADWVQLVRFCFVGTSGFVVNLAVFALLHYVGLHYVPAALAAFAVSWSSNFVLNRRWTFRRRDRPCVTQGLRYLLVSIAALGLGLGVLSLLVETGLPEVPAQAISIVIVTPVSFLLNRRWSFR